MSAAELWLPARIYAERRVLAAAGMGPIVNIARRRVVGAPYYHPSVCTHLPPLCDSLAPSDTATTSSLQQRATEKKTTYTSPKMMSAA